MWAGDSLHKKDWLKIGVGVASAATGLGAAGIGPLAGLLGGAGAAGGESADPAGHAPARRQAVIGSRWPKSCSTAA